MAMTTQCPHCGAAFKVVADQLRLRDGLVRCGVCTAVFDGRAHLHDAGSASATATTAQSHEFPAIGTPVRFPPAPPFDAPRVDTPAVVRRPVVTPPFDIPPSEAPVLPPFPAEVPAVIRGREVAQPHTVDYSEAPVVMRTRADYPQDQDLWVANGRTPESDAAPGEAYLLDPPSSAPAEQRAADDQNVETIEAHAPIFGEMRANRAYREPQWRDPQADRSDDTDPDAVRGEPRTRFVDDPHSGRTPPEFMDHGVSERRQSSAFGWGVASLLLLLVLLGLSAYVYRTQLATAVPVLRPALTAGCQMLGCAVGYERRIERISIVSSSLTAPPGAAAQEGDGQNLILQMVLRNRFNAPQPWPAITLELNDLSDTVVLRKTILPADYLSATELGTPFGPNAEQRVRLPLSVSGLKVNGYQLDKFFP